MSSIQVSCQVCYVPFGTLDNDRAPYALSCSHICCIGCLGVHQSSCPLCYMANDDAACRRVLNLRPDISKISSPGLQDVDRMRQLQDAISRVDEQTSLYRLRHLHEMANSFLETQPRNRVRDLRSVHCHR
ncbi:hypothetical protein CPB83DRAFT_428451 [Crepidotus variabilis]|uniref:RING-type domain-containing protein n=1 Tax=Crepidotus variabilis TaxID=179855 RepID=A0A9P6EDT0_9AGAR|nr:hypothetical protein CPB83DRAFT_428451 [Crepidotus variabilis]